MAIHAQTQPTTRHPLTVEIYMQMLDAGILGDDDPVELLNGELYEISPIGSRHAAVVDKLNFRLSRLFRADVIIRIQSPIWLSDISMPQPDLALLRMRSDFYVHAQLTAEDVLMLIEVADSSLAYDTQQKLPAYAASGIPEAWIVDLATDRIDRHVTPTDQGYRIRERFQPADTIQSMALPAIALPVYEVLGLDQSTPVEHPES